MTYSLELPGRPVGLNAERKGNRYRRHDATKLTRNVSAMLWRSGVAASGYPATLPSIQVTARQLAKDGRWLLDVGSILPTVKAAIDGLVDAGLIPNDTAEYVTRLVFLPPEIVGRDALLLDVTP
jgi:hypothetical protein